MGFDIASGDRYRLEQRVTGPDGESSLVIKTRGSVTLDVTGEERKLRRFRAELMPGVYERLVTSLHEAGFPNAPVDASRPTRTRVVSAIRGGRELRTRPFHSDTASPGWAEACALLDAIGRGAAGGALGEPDGEALVTRGAEVPLFHATEGSDEPPLGEDANEVVSAAWQLAIERRHQEVHPLHLLVALVRDHGYQLERLGLDPDRVQTAGEALFTWDPPDGSAQEPLVTKAFQGVLDVARRIAAEDGAHEGALRHLVRALLQAGGTDVIRILQTHRLPDAMLGGRTRERIFQTPTPSIERRCPRCGALAAEHRWCPTCGRASAAPTSFQTGSVLDRILPKIEPYDFAERSVAAHRSLCNLPDQPGTPWLTFVIESQGSQERVSPSRLAELGIDLEHLELSALANLARVPASWTPRWLAGVDGRNVDLLFCVDEPWAAERVLERPFLLHAQMLLGSNALVAALPTRSTLLVGRLENLAFVMALAQQHFAAAAGDGLSEWGFSVHDGIMNGPIPYG